MNKYKSFIPKLWEFIFLTLSIYLLVIAKPFKEDSYLLSVLSGTATCIMTAILILYIQRTSKAIQLLKYYSKIEDTYVRIDMGQDNTGGLEITDIKNKNLNLEIVLIYQGDNKFKAVIQYWKNENAEAISTFEFNETNKMIGSGTYKYIKGKSFSNHFGSMQIFLLEDEPNRIYIRYQHVFPREVEYNPDNNRGWEIWERKNRS